MTNIKVNIINLHLNHPIISVIYCKYIWDKSNIIPLSLIAPHYSAPSAYLLSPAAYPPPETPPVLALNFVDGIMRGLIHDHILGEHYYGLKNNKVYKMYHLLLLGYYLNTDTENQSDG